MAFYDIFINVEDFIYMNLRDVSSQTPLTELEVEVLRESGNGEGVHVVHFSFKTPNMEFISLQRSLMVGEAVTMIHEVNN